MVSVAGHFRAASAVGSSLWIDSKPDPFAVAVIGPGFSNRNSALTLTPSEAGSKSGTSQPAPATEVPAQAHTDDEVDHLTRLGADLTVMGEREIGGSATTHRTASPPLSRSRTSARHRSHRFAQATHGSQPTPQPSDFVHYYRGGPRSR